MTANPLTPGPAADARVAEAMGKKVCWRPVGTRMIAGGGAPVKSPSKRLDSREECLAWCNAANDRWGGDWKPVYCGPAYTTSWAGLGEMVEWMQSAPRNDCLTLVWMGSLAGGGMAWDAHFRMAGKHGVADTPMLAVAEALLAAVEEETTHGET